MTDEQIVKALECCAKNIRCDECPLKGIKNCMGELYIKSFDLIKWQQAEIEELKKAGNKIDSLGLVATLMDQKERLVRVKNEWEREIRAEAVREFAERLKETNLYEFIEEYFDNAELCYEVRSDLFNDFIDNLAREMTEKEGGKG